MDMSRLPQSKSPSNSFLDKCRDQVSNHGSANGTASIPSNTPVVPKECDDGLSAIINTEYSMVSRRRSLRTGSTQIQLQHETIKQKLDSLQRQRADLESVGEQAVKPAVKFNRLTSTPVVSDSANFFLRVPSELSHSSKCE